MWKIYLIALGLIIALTSFFFRINDTSETSKRDEGISIVTSFYPLYYFTSQIVQNTAQVTNVTPSGAEPHDYEPSTRDIALMENSDLVILNGVGLEPWGETLFEILADSQTTVVFTAEDLATQSVQIDGNPVKDPHIWLDPILAKQQVQKIADAIINIDPDSTEEYKQRTTDLQQKLDQLDEDFRTALKKCNQNTVITSHEAFGYLAARYGFVLQAISGISPEEEPSAQQMAEIASLAKEKNIKYIFFETLVSPKIAETIASEVGAQTLVFNPLEGLTDEDLSTAKDYFSIQQENIKNLATALECN